MINGIEGQFGSWKSSLATHIAYKVALVQSNFLSRKLLQNTSNIILSNIKMEGTLFKNYFYFEDDKFLEILRTANLLNDVERAIYTKSQEGKQLLKYKRSAFTNVYIFFDEVGAIMNNRNYKEFDTVMTEYINQNRKNFQHIYVITADWEQTEKSLRRFVDWWYNVEPFWNFWIFKNIWVIRRVKKDKEGKILMQPYLGKDQNGDYITKYKPVQETVSYFWKPSVWKYYDDLHKNIRDIDKYNGANIDLLKQIIDKKPELTIPFHQKFLPLITGEIVQEQKEASYAPFVRTPLIQSE